VPTSGPQRSSATDRLLGVDSRSRRPGNDSVHQRRSLIAQLLRLRRQDAVEGFATQDLYRRVLSGRYGAQLAAKGSGVVRATRHRSTARNANSDSAVVHGERFGVDDKLDGIDVVGPSEHGAADYEVHSRRLDRRRQANRGSD
jgi:hypothetical protein